MKNLSLRWRLLIPIYLIAVSLGIFATIQLADNGYTQSLGIVQQQMTDSLKMLDFSMQGDWVNIEKLVKTDAAALADEITILTPSGEILYQTGPERDVSLSNYELQQALTQGSGFLVRRLETGEPFAYAALASPQTNGSLVLLHSQQSIQDLDALRARTYRTIWASTLIALGLFTIAIAFITKRIDTRLTVITQKVRDLENDQFDAPIPLGVRDELSLVEHALNDLSNTWSKQIQQREAEHTQRNAILEQMSDGVMIVDPESQITLVNPAAKRIFGLNDSRVMGERLARVLGRHQIVELWQKFKTDGKDQAAFLELSDLKQSIYVSLIPFENVLPGYAMFLFQDLTKIRHLETVRRDFISNISHELRTPLASLKALAETLQISALDDPEAAHRFLSKMDTEIDALTQLVSELLELSRIESGQLPLQFERVSPENLLTSAFERLRVQADRSEIDYTLTCPETSAVIMADSSRLEQTLVNLIHNAIKFTDAGGVVHCSFEVDAGEVIFSIQDSGVGIPAKDLPRIFERFYKVRGSRKTSGTGLGLAIAKHLVELHHGRIWAESQLGVGSTFFIAIPLAR